MGTSNHRTGPLLASTMMRCRNPLATSTSIGLLRALSPPSPPSLPLLPPSPSLLVLVSHALSPSGAGPMVTTWGPWSAILTFPSLALAGKSSKSKGHSYLRFSRSCCRRRMLSAEDKLEQRDIAAMSPGMPSPSQMASPSLARSPPWLETYPELIGQMQGVFEEWREEREQLLRNAEQTQAYCQSLAFQVKSLQEENGRLQKEMARQLQDEEVEQAEALSRLKSECAVLKSAHEALQQEHARTLSEKTRLERENSDLVNALAVEAQGSSTDKVNPSPGPSQRESLVSDDESGLDVMFDQSLAAEMRLVVSPPMPSHLVDVGVVGASRSEELKPVAEVLREGPVPIHT